MRSRFSAIRHSLFAILFLFAAEAANAQARVGLNNPAVQSNINMAGFTITGLPASFFDLVQAFDADLTSLAGATGTNTIYYRSAANTWSAVTIGSNLAFSGGTLSATGGGGGITNTALAGTVPLTDDLSGNLAASSITEGIGTTFIGNLNSNGFVKTTNGTGQLAVDPTQYTPTARTISTTAPLTGGGDLSGNRTFAINNAAADGSTKGAASFTAADFDATSGNISLDYTNGQKATGSVPGFLSSSDWTTFNGKAPATSGTSIVKGNGSGGFSNAAAGTDYVAPNTTIGSIGITIDGAGSAITTGIKGYISIPYACTINSVTLLADQSGSAVVDVWKDTYANYPPTVADTITASAKPTISSATKSQDTTLTGWTTSVTAGDVLAYKVDSASTITRLTLVLKITK